MISCVSSASVPSLFSPRTGSIVRFSRILGARGTHLCILASDENVKGGTDGPAPLPMNLL